MARITLVYATMEGQTAKIAKFIAERLREAGHAVEMADARQLPPGFSLAAFDMAVLGASVHVGKHEAEMDRFAKENRDWLNAHPSAFFSVSMSAAEPGESGRQEATRVAETFLDHAGWQARTMTTIAGALQYSKYNWFKKQVVRFIVRSRMPEMADTHRDWEMTDWDAVALWAKEVAALAPVPVAA